MISANSHFMKHKPKSPPELPFWKHKPRLSQLDGDFYFDGDVLALPKVTEWVNAANGFKGWQEERENDFPKDLRDFLANLAIKRNGLGAIQVFEDWRKRKFFCFANATKKEIEMVLSPEVESKIEEYQTRPWTGEYITKNPNTVFCMEYGAIGYEEGIGSVLDRMRRSLHFVGSGFPTAKDVSKQFFKYR